MGSRGKSLSIFLDTHIVIWIYQKNLDLLSEKSREIIDANDIFISPVVILEIEYLYEIGKINTPAKKIIDYLKEAIGLQIEESSFKEIISVSLSEKWTRDPFDRIIVSHARFKKSALITADRKILKNYKKALF